VSCNQKVAQCEACQERWCNPAATQCNAAITTGQGRFLKPSALAQAVEFAEEDSLPGTEAEFAVFNDDGLNRPSEDGFHVRVGVPSECW
jgi:hypothetical protein